MSRYEKTGKRTFFSRVWLVLLLLLPTLVAVVGFSLIYNNYRLSPENIYDIKLYDEHGTEIAYESDYPQNAKKDSLISIFSPITENLSQSAELPGSVDKENYIRAVVEHVNTKKEYMLYFSLEDKTGYCVNGDVAYPLSEVDAKKILSSEFAESLYVNAVAPKMYTISGEAIVPSRVDWSYMTAVEDYALSKSNVTSTQTVEYEMAGALGLSFSREPDRCNVTVYQDNKKIFYGNYTELSLVTSEQGKALHIDVEAVWQYAADVDSYGKINYSFDAFVSDRADFYVTGETFAVDSFCGIFCTNVKDTSKIIFSSEPTFPTVPEFELSGKNAVALLPIMPETEPGEYEITITYGATTEKFLLTVKRRVGGITVDCEASEDAVTAGLGETAEKELVELKKFASKNTKGDKLFYGDFLDYTDMGATLYAHLGDIYLNTYSNYESRGHEYRFDGVGGVSVGALNGGRVIKTGYNDYLGNYVIVSHGCGLATWYAHLGMIDVSEGDFVVKGEAVGKTGQSGLCSKENVLILATLGDDFTNPKYICGQKFD